MRSRREGNENVREKVEVRLKERIGIDVPVLAETGRDIEEAGGGYSNDIADRF